MPVIRRALAEDALGVKEIETACALSPWPLEDYIAEPTRDDALFLVAETGGRLVGFLAARLITISNHASENKPIHCEMQVHNIAVLPSSRRLGLAGRLLATALAMIPQNTSFDVFLEVRARNAGAVAFYENRGFAIVGKRRGFYSDPTDDALIMRLSGGSR